MAEIFQVLEREERVRLILEQSTDLPRILEELLGGLEFQPEIRCRIIFIDWFILYWIGCSLQYSIRIYDNISIFITGSTIFIRS